MSGGEVALRLFAAFRDLVDEVHAELAGQGHPGVRPAHGFALQAVGAGGATAVELARRLGVSKQAAGKTVDGLIALGYAERTADPADARRKIVSVTDAGREVLAVSADAFDRALAARVAGLGTGLVAAFEDALRAMTAGAAPRVDAAAWLTGPDPSS